MPTKPKPREAAPHGKGMGYIPDLPDMRDRLYAPKRLRVPREVDLRTTKSLPPVYDQDQLGSCTAQAIAAVVDFNWKKQGKTFRSPSRLFIYYEERVIEGTIDEDAGAMLRDGIKVVAKVGVCREKQWPYDMGRFTEAPPTVCYDDADLNVALTYERVSSSSWQDPLARGFPIVFGISVYDSFMSDDAARTGIIPMPSKDEDLLGGHAIALVGYKYIGAKLYAICRNSWGKRWGDKGYFYLPAEYITTRGLSSDFWVVTSTGKKAA